MSRWEQLLLQLSTALVGGTGLVYGWMRYLARPDDPFSVVNHPWQPATQHLHVVLAPALVFALGVLWRGHASPQLLLGTQRRRRSGLWLLSIGAPMALSGYLLQVAVEPPWRRIWIVLHVATSLLWLAGWARHSLLRRANGSPGLER